MAWLSALKDGAWRVPDTGWELQEYEAREAEVRRREIATAKLASLLPGTDDARHVCRQIRLSTAWNAAHPQGIGGCSDIPPHLQSFSRAIPIGPTPPAS
jgi:hypothetical protein